MAESSTSSKRVEANRKDAERSTETSTTKGNFRSSINAMKQGMCAANLVLPGEDCTDFGARLAAWTAALQPRDDVECFLVRRAVQLSWQLERADRALAARSAEARLEYDEQVAGIADEVADLGRRLFWDPRGPLPLSLHARHDRPYLGPAYWSGEKDDPARLIILLEATPLGCAWLLDRWDELRELLERRLVWLPTDRFQAIRLLGRQPLDAADDDRVRTIYRACWVMSPVDENAYADVRPELRLFDWERFLERLGGREVAGSWPMDPSSARAILLELIATEEARLRDVLAQHVEREEASDFGRFFDQSMEGKRLRRYLISCGRALQRVLETLRRRRRDAEQPTRSAGGRARPKDLRDGRTRLMERIERLASSMAAAGTNEPKSWTSQQLRSSS